MKVLFIANIGVKSTGPKSVILSLTKHLVNNGVDVGIYTLSKKNQDIGNIFNNIGVKYYYIKNNKGIPNILNDIYDFNSYDIVHLHGIFSMKTWLISNSLIKSSIPYVVSIHGNLMKMALERSQFKKKTALVLIVKRILKKAKAIHALANNEKKDINKIINKNSIIVIPNGIEKKINTSNNISNKTDNNSKVILFLGRIDVYHKGIDLLLEAIVKKSEILLKNNTKFIFAGYFNKPEDEKRIYKVLDENPCLKKLVKFVGEVVGEEKNRLLSTCDLFIHTSRLEGMPMSVLEALSYGKPCLITKETNMEDIIEKSKAGIIVDLNSNSIGQGLEKVSKMENGELSTFGRNGQEYMNKHLVWDLLVEKYIEMYKRIVLGRLEGKKE